MKSTYKNICPFFILCFLFCACSQKKTELAWNQSLHRVGTQSSPKATDLNRDGIKDIIIGAGIVELGETEQGIIALDGNTGAILWQAAANASMVGSATFYDSNADGVMDVFIGGRNKNLKALNGKTGEILWEYTYQYEKHPILKYARFNFYNSTLVPDQNQDGHPELLTINGGNWNATPDDKKNRFPGVLMLLDIKNGAVIAADTMPDGKESYLSPLCFQQPNSQESLIVFGTGGETIGGHLYVTKLEDLVQQNLQKAIPIATEATHGFIAPPALADLNADGIYDITVTSHAGKIAAIDGKTYHPIWQQQFEGFESSNAFAVGYFTKDKTPDFFTSMSKGTWPNYSDAKHIMLDGKTGEIVYEKNIGCFNLASPVAYDLNKDGYEEVILSINDFDCNTKIIAGELSPSSISNQIVAIGFQSNLFQIIDTSKGFRNIYATPWIGDLDDDGYLDIIYSQNFNPNDLFRFLSMRVKRISTAIPMKQPVRWGEYMGQAGKGIFQ